MSHSTLLGISIKTKDLPMKGIRNLQRLREQRDIDEAEVYFENIGRPMGRNAFKLFHNEDDLVILNYADSEINVGIFVKDDCIKNWENPEELFAPYQDRANEVVDFVKKILHYDVSIEQIEGDSFYSCAA